MRGCLEPVILAQFCFEVKELLNTRVDVCSQLRLPTQVNRLTKADLEPPRDSRDTVVEEAVRHGGIEQQCHDAAVQAVRVALKALMAAEDPADAAVRLLLEVHAEAAVVARAADDAGGVTDFA